MKFLKICFKTLLSFNLFLYEFVKTHMIKDLNFALIVLIKRLVSGAVNQVKNNL